MQTKQHDRHINRQGGLTERRRIIANEERRQTVWLQADRLCAQTMLAGIGYRHVNETDWLADNRQTDRQTDQTRPDQTKQADRQTSQRTS